MFIPPAFAEHDLPTLQRFIRQNSFGVVVSQVDGSPFGSHRPILFDPLQESCGKKNGEREKFARTISLDEIDAVERQLA